MSFIQLTDKQKELNDLRENGSNKGRYCGFRSLEPYFSFVKGYPLFIGAEPHAGKTEFVLELLVFTAEKYGWKHFLYLGETGEERDVFSELCSKYIQKPYSKKLLDGKDNSYAMSESERVQAEMFVSEHFVLYPTDADFDYKQFYDAAKTAEQQIGITFDTTCIDPVIDVSGFENKQEYLNEFLKYVRRSSKDNNRIDILIAHVGETAKILDKNSQKRYKLAALPEEWGGGKTWFRRAFPMILLYRPPDFIIDTSTGDPIYAENEVHVIIQKAKPKGLGRLGQCSLYWDWKRNRYYEKDSMNMDRYAGETPEGKFNQVEEKQPEITENAEFLAQTDNVPF